MKRFHVHLHVDDLDKNIGFHSTLLNQPPFRTEADYAKWMLEEPPVNFAISTRGEQLGIQTDNAEEPLPATNCGAPATGSSSPATGCSPLTSSVTAGACCAPSSTAPSSATSCC
jgi:hypothetical protein